MPGEFDVGTATLRVNVFEDGQMVAQIACETADEAAEIVADWEERDGVKCEVDDLSVHHDATDVLSPEPEDGL